MGLCDMYRVVGRVALPPDTPPSQRTTKISNMYFPESISQLLESYMYEKKD